MGARTAPAGSVVSLDGLELVPLEPAHAAIVLEMATRRGNQYLIDLGRDEEEVARVLAQLARAPWALSLAVLRGAECVGMATTGLANLRSMNASILGMFVDPPSAGPALALCIRHLFWNFPLHRIHTQVPLLDLTREYVDLYRAVGFEDEGRLHDHALVGGQAFDAAVLGLLRPEFEAWCAAHEPRLALT